MAHAELKKKIYFPTKGLCIYCKTKDSPLNKEHILAHAMGGLHIIRNASCRKCEDITKKIEQDVTRGLWFDARASYNAPTRHKKDRPTHITLQDPNDRQNKLTIPYSEYPGVFVFYQMGIAGILQGISEHVDLSSTWKLTSITDNPRLKEFLNKYQNFPLTARFKHVPLSYGRMFAKTGYCHALSVLDVDDFHPTCLPYILGEKSNVSYIIGESPTAYSPIMNTGYTLGNEIVLRNADHAYLISTVRMLADNYTPTYHVVVGEIFGQQNIKNVISKLQN